MTLFCTAVHSHRSSAATRKHTTVGQKYFKKGTNERLGGQKYTKYNKINSNSKTSGGPASPGCGPA